MTSVIKFSSDSVLAVSSTITDRGNKRLIQLTVKAQNLERSQRPHKCQALNKLPIESLTVNANINNNNAKHAKHDNNAPLRDQISLSRVSYALS